jgi:hypothetical protein
MPKELNQTSAETSQKRCNTCGGTQFCGCGACLKCAGSEAVGMCYACLDDA